MRDLRDTVPFEEERRHPIRQLLAFDGRNAGCETARHQLAPHENL